MPIFYDQAAQIFHLQSPASSYALKVTDEGHLAHLYWGKRVRSSKLSYLLRLGERSFSPAPIVTNRNLSLDTLPQEYPTYGNSDFRAPACQVQLENGSTISDLRYAGHRIVDGKPALSGLPATYVEQASEASTLEIDLVDDVTELLVTLSYTVFENYDAVTRSVKFVNQGKQNLRLLRVLSASIDFSDAAFDMLQLSGAWGRERHVVERPLAPGTQSVESRRGASSHQQNPFIALLRKDATQNHGEVYGFNLVYSGNFLASAEVDQYATTRVSIGLNPFDFSWLLEPGQIFQAPEVVLAFSDQGMTGLTQTYHALYRNRLCRGAYRDQARPVLINNWEATYFDFTDELIIELAREAQHLGIELFILDDGWFGSRNDDHSSLGDWFANTDKIKCGLDGLAKQINDLGMKFGLWFEPEMVSPDSDLYRAHPDWCLHVPQRARSESRNQLVLDFSRADVCAAIIDQVSNVLSSANIEYVKWDMNRHMTEIGSAVLPAERQRETAHRYMLGLYRVLETLTTRFPHILFESCSGGGGRFDPGMLYYMPQTWTSDDTDAVERLRIQFGTSIAYPAITMGSHVSAVPNHQVHRITPLQTRGHVAMSGNFGYELDLTKLTDAEKQLIQHQVAFYKQIRGLVQFGAYYPLISPFGSNEAAWMFVSDDQQEALVAYFRVLQEANDPYRRLRLQGLQANTTYQLTPVDPADHPAAETRYGGDELMHIGLHLPRQAGDFQSCMWRIMATR